MVSELGLNFGLGQVLFYWFSAWFEFQMVLDMKTDLRLVDLVFEIVLMVLDFLVCF